MWMLFGIFVPISEEPSAQRPQPNEWRDPTGSSGPGFCQMCGGSIEESSSAGTCPIYSAGDSSRRGADCTGSGGTTNTSTGLGTFVKETLPGPTCNRSSESSSSSSSNSSSSGNSIGHRWTILSMSPLASLLLVLILSLLLAGLALVTGVL